MAQEISAMNIKLYFNFILNDIVNSVMLGLKFSWS